MCCCLEIKYLSPDGSYVIISLTILPEEFNGFCTYSFVIDSVTFYVWWDGSEWLITDAVGSLAIKYARMISGEACPITIEPVFSWDVDNITYFESIVTSECVTLCPCINIGIVQGINVFSEDITQSGTYNNRYYYVFVFLGIVYYLYYNGQQWLISIGSIGGSGAGSSTITDQPCPDGLIFATEWSSFDIIQIPCPPCIPDEERIFREYQSIKLPDVFEEEDRGFFKCCEPQLVLADPFSEDSWKSDITSAWIKLSDPTDTSSIVLLKDGQPTAYPVSIVEFPNEPDAFYRTIFWKDVLATDGVGCYTIEVTYDISGMAGSFTWGLYELKQFSTENALKTARIRCKFNLKQSIEGINFTGSQVEDTVRFYGFIGDRQPNTEIDNLIYQSRVVKTVTRENLDSYIIGTDPYTDEMIRRLTNLYLLSENEMWISDYNAFNHSYRVNDLAVIVQESPEIDYLDQYQRKAVLTCLVGDRIKNKRTYY